MLEYSFEFSDVELNRVLVFLDICILFAKDGLRLVSYPEVAFTMTDCFDADAATAGTLLISSMDLIDVMAMRESGW